MAPLLEILLANRATASGFSAEDLPRGLVRMN
jgi:hypothetical protein